jgi:hypothetical protein
MGREWGGGGQFRSNLGPGWTRIAPHRKEGFQVSERDSGTKEGRQPKGILTRGIIKGFRQGVVPCALILSTCIYVSCYCVNVANKIIVFRL